MLRGRATDYFGNKVLVSVKQTRLKTESDRLNLQGLHLDAELCRRGFNVHRLHESHSTHHGSLESVTSALEARNLPFTVQYARELSSSSVEGVSFVISVGGDGTFLETAQLVKDPTIPVLAVNSDPQTSVGKLCSVAMRSPDDFETCLTRIERGFFSWYLRARVGLILIEANGNRIKTDRAAVNEMLFAEQEVCRPTMHQIQIDENPLGPIQKTSGVLVCSGSGSTAWMNSACAIRVDDTELIMKAIRQGNGKGLIDDELSSSSTSTEAFRDAARIANIINREMVLPPTCDEVMYFVRESLSFQPDAPRRGVAKSVAILSLGFDTYIFMDGLAKVPIENGTMAVMGIDPDRTLRTFLF